MIQVTANQSIGIKRLSLTLLVLVFVICTGSIASAYISSKNTGILDISTSDKQAVLSVSQVNKDTVLAGTGNASIRLKPGTYRIAANTESKRAVAVVTVSKKTVTHSKLVLDGSPLLRSIYSINFTGLDGLISSGLTETQISALQSEFFRYNSLLNTVNIDQNSVKPVARDPNGSDPSFYINFAVRLNDTAYTATISYADLDNVRLVLHTPETSAVVFDSDAASTQIGE